MVATPPNASPATAPTISVEFAYNNYDRGDKYEAYVSGADQARLIQAAVSNGMTPAHFLAHLIGVGLDVFAQEQDDQGDDVEA